MREFVIKSALTGALAIHLVCFGLVPALIGAEERWPEQTATNPFAAFSHDQPAASRTQILVFGTFHLAEIEKSYRPEMFARLLATLETFHPDAIAVESLPGDYIDGLERRQATSELHRQLLDDFAGAHIRLGRMAQTILKSTRVEAQAKADELLAATARRSNPSVEQRATLTLNLLAAYELDSALLQWSYFSPEERVVQTAIPSDLAIELEKKLKSVNEIPVIAASLARYAGLQRLYAVDDFEDLDTFARVLPELMRALEGNQLLAAAGQSPIYVESKRRLGECVAADDVEPMYRFLNSAEYEAADVDAQWSVFLRTRLPNGVDRGRLALWENRNLKIAARIRVVSARHPGGRILVIYGAAHKPFLDAYLGRMSDVEVVQFAHLPRNP